MERALFSALGLLACCRASHRGTPVARSTAKFRFWAVRMGRGVASRAGDGRGASGLTVRLLPTDRIAELFAAWIFAMRSARRASLLALAASAICSQRYFRLGSVETVRGTQECCWHEHVQGSKLSTAIPGRGPCPRVIVPD